MQQTITYIRDNKRALTYPVCVMCDVENTYEIATSSLYTNDNDALTLYETSYDEINNVFTRTTNRRLTPPSGMVTSCRVATMRIAMSDYVLPTTTRYIIRVTSSISNKTTTLLCAMFDTYDMRACAHFNANAHRFTTYVDYEVVVPTTIDECASCMHVELIPVDVATMTRKVDAIESSTFITNTSQHVIVSQRVQYDELTLSFDATTFERIKQQYNVDVSRIEIVSSLRDDTNAYAFASLEKTKQQIIDNDYEIVLNVRNYEQQFTNINEFIERLRFSTIVTFFDSNNANVEMSLNDVYVTQHMFAFIVNDENAIEIDFTKLNDMNVQNFDVINKIETNVLRVDSRDDKSFITQPVFYRTNDTNNAFTLYKGVVQNIGIDITRYRSIVDSFVLKIDDAYFNEIGRQQNTSLFRVDASHITSTHGNAYLLDASTNELVFAIEFNIK